MIVPRMKAVFALLRLLCSLVLCLPALAAQPAVVIVVLPPATLQDWQRADAPTLHHLMQTGALGVMNTRTAHQAGHDEAQTLQSALLTLGAGARAAGTAFPSRFLPASSALPGTEASAASLFQRRTAAAVQPGRSVCLDWPAVAAANHNPGYDLSLGNLAETLAAHGVSVASGGGANADWLAAGSSGTVRHMTELRAAPGLCLIWGAADLPSAEAALAKAAAQVTMYQGCLIVVSPLAGSAANKQLAPVLVWGLSIPAGVLRSPSTHRPGLIINTDFAPSVAACFGIPRSAFRVLPFGFAWSEASASDAAGVCTRLNAEAVRQSQGMRLLPYTAAVLGFWILAVTMLASRLLLPRIALLVPFITLTAALLAVSAASFGLLLLALAGSCLAFAGSRKFVPYAAACLSLILCADMGTGNTLMHRGLLGYSALEGARYYGLGNEAMGLLLGASLIAVSRLWSPRVLTRLTLIGGMAGIIVLLGSAGAKAGGVLVSLAVYGTFLYTASGHAWTARTILMLAAVMVTGIGLAALGDAFFHGGSHSHIGEAVHRITVGGAGEGWDVVTRKLAVEGRLAYHSAWALLLWLELGCTLWLWKTLPALDSRDRAFRLAGSAGVWTCLLLNDAGVVAAAIFGIFLWTAAVTQKSASRPRNDPGPEST